MCVVINARRFNRGGVDGTRHNGVECGPVSWRVARRMFCANGVTQRKRARAIPMRATLLCVVYL